MIAAAFLVLLRPYSIQCALLLLLLVLGTVATILFFCTWHRKLQKVRPPIRTVFGGRARRDAVMRYHHLRSEGFRPSPRHARRGARTRVEETKPVVEVRHSDQETQTSQRRRKIKKSSRVQPDFYHSVQVTPTRRLSSGNASYRCSMSSSADFSDDEDYSQRSGSASPAPGDTLPWNLPRHERSKRKIQGGSVLDPAERAVLRIADERDKVQKKTFTKWINQHLMKVRKHVNDLYEDLRDGHNLISLLEVLSGDTLPREKGRMRFHRLQNVQIALDYLKKRQVKLVNIRNDDITDGNPKLTLGLIWTIILHFQISDIHVTGESQDMSAKEKLLLWTQRTTDGYGGIRCENFTTCWRDGRLFNAIIHRYRPDLIDMNIVAVQSNTANLENAFYVAEKLGVTRLLDPEDVDVSSPDEKSVITYVSSLYDAFPKVPEDGEGINANDVEVKWVEYQNMVNYLIQWIRHHATLMSDRTFPNNPAELKALYNQYLQFKETEIPPKENEKSRIKHFYKLLEVWIEFGRVKLPQGYHPNDIEKEWGKLIIAMLEREKTLRPEVDRLEMLQQIAARIQRDSLGCEDKLILAQNAVHADAKRLESGLQLQHEAEITGYLLESENLLRQQLNDAQVLLDGKYYQAEQIVQRVAKLRDDLIALRNECSSVYSTGRALTTEQTKYMMSGITQSLNSGFAQNLSPSLNSGLPQNLSSLAPSSLTTGLPHGMNARMTPALNPSFPANYGHGLIQNYMPSVDTAALQNLKLMQIRKPTMKSAIADQNMTDEEVNMNFVNDLLSWVDEMQVQLERAEWGSDLPSVESHLENHKNVHKAIEEFETSLKEAKTCELQMTGPYKPHYSEKLRKLESHYSKLLHSSRSRARHLDTLHNVVSRATRELIWLNEKEEEEVAYDWSERVPNLSRKKEYHAALMRELDHKEESMRAVQDLAEQLLVENHPARLTIEAYRAAMQTQWSWILQLCHCVEQHLRENSEYFEFFNDAKEAMDYLKHLKDAVLRKYSCDKSSSLHKLEVLLQESMEEKSQLLQYKSTVASLVGRAKAIIQLKPRNPESPLKSSIPIKAICDYRQIEITIYKNDECILAGNSHRAKWKVISPSGNEAMVPSVCFTVPPPNKEAIDTANRIEQLFQSVLTLWHESHVNMKSVVSFHFLTNEIEEIRASNVSSIKTTLPGEHQQVLSSLRSRFEDFTEDSQESKIFTVSDIGQLEREVNVCRQYYEELLRSAEREEQEESIYNLYISEVRNIRLRLETCEERLIRQIRTPLERDDLHESVFKISEQEKVKKELERLKDDLGGTTDKCEEFFNQAAASLSVPTLRSELNAVIQNMNHIYSLSSIYLEKLKTINLVLQNTQGAESLVKLYETKLCEEDAATSDKKAIEMLVATLKHWRSEVDEKREVFHALEDELQKAKAISDQMFKTHKERDLDFDWHKEKADQLAERWQNVHYQIDSRLRDLDGIGKSLKYYKESYTALDDWITQVEDTQRRLQENQPENSKALAKHLHQQKNLVSEIEMKQHKMDECQKYSEQYSASVKDYELQLMTFRAMVDSHQKSPVKRRRMQSSSDLIIQEYMELRTRYTALLTLMTQYVKFAAETQKRMEEEEKSVTDEKKEHVGKARELLNWVSNVSNAQKMEGAGERIERAALPLQQVSSEEMEVKKEQISEVLQSTQVLLAKHGDRMADEEKNEMEEQLKSLQETYNLLSEEIVRQKQEAQHLSDRKVEEKDVKEQQQEHTEKLQEICDLLTETENRLIGQQDASAAGDSTAELQHYKMEHEELQKDMQAGASELAEVVKNTEKFLQENGDKLSPKDRAVIEKKLSEAKTKFELLRKRAEESKKELDKAVTTAMKQETEKVAAVEQLEESTHKIESLLDWLSNVDENTENGQKKRKKKMEQNGTHKGEDEVNSISEGMEEVNGNVIHSLQTADTSVEGHPHSKVKDLQQQYQNIKAQHEKLVSQHQDVIIATQSAQALLEKQGCYLSPEDKEKLQRNMSALKAQYETSLAESDRKMKLIQSVQEELEKFTTDYKEFESWLKQSKEEMENLEVAATDFSGVGTKLQRQKSFSEDVISHKGDLRYITISGQRVIDTAKSFCKGDGVESNQEDVDTSATCTMVQSKLDTAADHFKSLYSKCNILGNNLKDLVDKYEHYKDVSSGVLSGLQASETVANKRLSEPIAVDPKNLQRQLEETKALQGQITTHQVAVEKTRKAAEVLLDTRGALLPNTDEIQTTLDDIVERYDNLSKSVNDRNEKLQITLTRSLSVQDGLDEMLDWLGGVEKGLKEQSHVPLNSAAIEDIVSKSIMLEQDIASRQSSVNAMNEKVNKFMETADPSTASSLQRKMNDLSGRFSEASGQQKERLAAMESLKSKVELFEDISDKVQCYLERKFQALSETDPPGKDVTELSQYMQETSIELTDHKKDVEVLQQLLEEISVHGLPGDQTIVSEKVNALSKKFKELEDTVKEKEEDVSSCQSQMDTFNHLVESLQKWIESTTTKIPMTQPTFCVDELKKPLEDSKKLHEEWTSKEVEVQKINKKGASLCTLITAVTSPAKSRATAKAGRLISNGDGKPPGAKGFLTNKELTAIQQDMSDINSSYDGLGALLREKVSGLERRLAETARAQEDLSAMTRWLQQMEATLASWEPAPTDSAAVKARVEQHKAFESDLKQNACKLEELRRAVGELVERNASAPEAAEWKQMLADIGSKWDELNRLTADRQQKLEESSNYLSQFQCAEAQLGQWLAEKELMASVLGPLSIDPNMLNTQKQQVQILLKEFDTRKPQYEQLNTAGQGILNGPGELPPSCEVVKEQLSAVAEKWDSLTGQLSDRCERIDQAIVKSTEFQSLLKDLSEKLTAVDNKLSSSQALSASPDAVKQQLATAREVQQEIKQETKTLEAAQALCEELSALVREEYLKAELARQLESIVKPLKDTEKKADRYVEQLQSAYASSQQFQQMSKDFQDWLDEKKKEHSQAPPASAKLDTLCALINKQAEIQKSLADQLPTYENVTREGESLLQKTQGAERTELHSQLGTLKSNWGEINRNAAERQNKLKECQQKALKYRENVESLTPWLEECQRKLSEIKVCIHPLELENSIGQAKSLQKNVEKQRRMVELLNNAAEGLLNACETDSEVIRDETALLNQQMDTITEQIHSKKDSLENMAQRLKEFQEILRDTERQIRVSREQLEQQNTLGVQACSNKHLTSMQNQQKTLQALQPNVDLTKKVAQELVTDATDAAGVSDLLRQAESLEQEHSAVSKQVEDRCSFLEAKLQGIGHFQNTIREMFSQFAEFDDELDGMSPIARDRATLQTQKADINSFLKKLGDLIKSNENANKTCKMLLATEAPTDLVGIKRDLEALSKQCNKLLDRANTRGEQVEGTLNRLEEWYEKLKDFSGQLGEAEKHEESQGQVGMETDMINQQLNIFQVFQKEEIEPLHVRLQEVNWLGQGLIQSAAKNTDTQSLERDLDDVNTRWNTLNKKVAERAAQLQEALLHCGRFQDALESLLCWLTDTEELIANQKPPSAEFKVVKAQIQEQKLLQRLLDDRRPTVEVIKREGEKIAESAEPADKEKILKQLDTLGHKWDVLLKKAEMRNRQLEDISVVAEQFHETLEPLVEWLSTTEKRLANSEPIGTQASKLQKQISQQKALEDDILTRNKTLYHAISIGQSLKTMSSGEDKDMVQGLLDASQARYIDIQETSSRRCDLLQQAHFNAQIFGDDEVELMNWLNEAHDELSKLTVQDYSTNVLLKQHDELLLLQEDILLRKQNVDQAIQNGLELLKQTTGDEVVVIQEKLDGIKARYSDITKLSGDVSKNLEQALQLAEQLQSTHEDLCRWLDAVEVELLSYEAQVPKGDELGQVQQRQKELQEEAKSKKGLLDSLNTVSSALLELVPWRAREGLDKMVTEDNERYRLVSDTVRQKVQEIDAAMLKSQQFENAAETELHWIDNTVKKMSSLGDIRLEQDQTTAQLQAQKAFTMEILRHKDVIDQLIASADEIMNNCSEEEKQSVMNKLDTLVKKYDVLCHLNSERNLQLERAQSLVSQFWETYEELCPWLTETETIIAQLPAPALEYETLKQQQEEIRQLRELIAEHKPHIDKMNKTGPQLLELSPTEGFSIQEKYVAADILFSKIKEDVKKRAVELDDAISQSSQFHDKIDPMLESLDRIADRLRQPPSISAEVEKIREQLSDNKNVSVELEKLQPGYETLKQRGEEMIARSEGADKDISAKAVQDKLDQMVFIWEDIQALTEEREAKLLDVMELAEKFWCDHIALVVTTKDTQDFIRDLEEPGVDPSVVKQQQEAAEAIREEIDGLQEELDVVINLGAELIAACGEPDKPVVNKSIDELNSAWDSLNRTWKDRIYKLNEAMQAAVQYQDGLQAIFDWIDIAGGKLDSMPPIGTDLETVKQQIAELKQYKSDAYQQQIEMEKLNHQKEILLKKVTDEMEKHAVQDCFAELKTLWNSLEEKIVNRQHKLEGALLALGQFQHALDELLTWLTHTEELLNDQKPVGGDPKAIEIALAKHHVLQNDVLAHESTIRTVKKAGNDLIESSAGEEANSLWTKLQALNQRWEKMLEATEQRRQQLDIALCQAQGFHSEIEDLQQWLADTERQLLSSKPVGGLPETAREQLNSHLELYADFEAKEEVYKSLMQKGQHLLARSTDPTETNVEQDVNSLQEKWESVETRLNERKTKLEEALSLATDFHNSLQDFINWLTQAEQTLTMSSPASLILDTVLFQIDEHKVFVTEVNAHRDQIMQLDKTGTHLKYFSQKQDVVLIKNLLISVQSRWENVVQRSVERGRALDESRKRAKQFHDAFNKLTEWLDESENSLDSELEIANDPDKLKAQLTTHKEFQKTLGAKHSVYDTTIRSGRSLKEKASLADDSQKLDHMLSEIRDKWDTVCGKSVERQNKLEEALLFSGQFTDALQALIDWLYRVEPQLAEDQPVHGDMDLVMNLIDNHKGFQKELGKRTSGVQALKRSSRELIESSRDDSSWVKVQMQELSTRWETVCALSVSKQTRLEQALRQAKEFHSAVHDLLEWLAEAEQALRFHGLLPDDEEALRALIDQHKEFMRKLEEKRTGLKKGVTMGDEILTICHPDSITTIKHWITIIRARFEEVLAWAKQHQQRLAGALAEVISKQELLETLLGWLQWAEATLNEKDKEFIPEEIDEVKALIAEHQSFMEEMTRKQPDVDKLTKTYKRKAADQGPVHSNIPVPDKRRAARKGHSTPGMYPTGSQAQIETKDPRVNMLVGKWQQVWLLALERRRHLNDALDRLEELREFANFDFDVWRKKYMRWMNHKKSRVMDFFRRIDKDQDGKITRQEFIEGILSSKFPTSRLEMSAVADIFDRDGDGYIDYYEFVAALHPNKDAYKPLTDADKIEDEVTRQVAKCKCAKRFQVEQIGDNKYRFGDSQQLRLVRILRSTVMVRVGGGWMALDEFLVKNDPCRAKGRTNMELREKFMLPDGPSQGMAAFRPRGRKSRPSSRGASPNRTNSVSSPIVQPGASQTPGTTTPKTGHPLARNYGKPWLANSKTSTPCKTPESPDCPVLSTEGTPITGSKLRLPGYLSGKGFQSGEDSSLLSTAATRVRLQFAESRKTPSRPDSRAGSKTGSRRGSDASDFDISEIQSVCSDMTDAAHENTRPSPRAGSRPSTGKPSKIPTPQRRYPASKLSKPSKR
ncbi:dystonin isoform X19 [Ambystoma mexicanum]|uniref:dystonin isoform X19 n=1 Tax=Ambystoma mexicanum TaxID=8296 RepID=UPI0037E8F355